MAPFVIAHNDPIGFYFCDDFGGELVPTRIRRRDASDSLRAERRAAARLVYD